MPKNPDLACIALNDLLARSLPSERDHHARKMPTGDHKQDPPSLAILAEGSVALRKLEIPETGKEVGRVGEIRGKEGPIDAELGGVGRDRRWRDSEVDKSSTEGSPVPQEGLILGVSL